jgi:DNA repair protein NreA
MDSLCIRCKGKGLCGHPCRILAKFKQNAPKPRLHFSGKSAPELFVGRIGYPNINSGILTPSENDNISNFPSAEEWANNNFSISNILRLRGQLIYGKSQMNIKTPNRLKQVTQELALSSKPVSTEIFLKKKPTFHFTIDKVFQPMTNPAPLHRAILEENPHVPKKVDYLINDTDIKSVDAINELYSANTKIDHLQKLLSIGLLGKKSARRMVPTRWSITATDDTISKEHLKKIRYFQQINQITLYSGNFLSNYIEFLILPGHFSFEAFEAWMSGSTYSSDKTEISSDFEGFNGRKKYAFNVTGGYYAMRLPLTEHLVKIKRQATVLVFREILPEYYAPLGVGIVRETARRAFQNSPKHFDTINEALDNISTRMQTPIKIIKEKSWILNNYGKQKSLNEFF